MQKKNHFYAVSILMVLFLSPFHFFGTDRSHQSPEIAVSKNQGDIYKTVYRFENVVIHTSKGDWASEEFNADKIDFKKAKAFLTDDQKRFVLSGEPLILFRKEKRIEGTNIVLYQPNVKKTVKARKIVVFLSPKIKYIIETK